ncbi:hypothetical protein F4604DRAFT_1678155 [Suillus subluteus]|nr:hypothetical protein F4604DRAFT_1678155 [Suillus subluteus]
MKSEGINVTLPRKFKVRVDARVQAVLTSYGLWHIDCHKCYARVIQRVLLNMKSRDTASAGAKPSGGHYLQYPGLRSRSRLARGHLGLLQALDVIMGVIAMLLPFLLVFLRGESAGGRVSDSLRNRRQPGMNLRFINTTRNSEYTALLRTSNVVGVETKVIANMGKSNYKMMV